MNATLVIPGDLAGARCATEKIEESLRASAYPEHDIFCIKLAFEEALVNAIKYDNQMDPDKRLHITYTTTAERFDICITAEGSGDGVRVITGRRS